MGFVVVWNLLQWPVVVSIMLFVVGASIMYARTSSKIGGGYRQDRPLPWRCGLLFHWV